MQNKSNFVAYGLKLFSSVYELTTHTKTPFLSHKDNKGVVLIVKFIA